VAHFSAESVAHFTGIRSLLLTGCGSTAAAPAGSTATTGSPVTAESNPVNFVKNGTLVYDGHAFSDTTVGKAFEGTFKNAKWTTFKSPKGITVVEFGGTVNAAKVIGLNLTHPNDEYYASYKSLATNFVAGCINKVGITPTVWAEDHPPSHYQLANLERLENGQRAELPKSELVQVAVLKCVAEQVDLPVSFQFTVASDGTSFRLSYFDAMFGEDPEKILAFIYQG
jgi:hypothetical protein